MGWVWGGAGRNAIATAHIGAAPLTHGRRPACVLARCRLMSCATRPTCTTAKGRVTSAATKMQAHWKRTSCASPAAPARGTTAGPTTLPPRLGLSSRRGALASPLSASAQRATHAPCVLALRCVVACCVACSTLPAWRPVQGWQVASQDGRSDRAGRAGARPRLRLFECRPEGARARLAQGNATEVGEFHSSPGGKGGGEAVQIAKLGVRAMLVGRVGNDELGEQTQNNLRCAARPSLALASAPLCLPARTHAMIDGAPYVVLRACGTGRST